MSEIHVGDTITFEGVYRLKWWQRVLVLLRLWTPPPQRPLQMFVVTDAATDER